MSDGRILVVDDEQSLREFLTILLEKEGYSVATAESVETAIASLRDASFDLVICDLKMPGIGGRDIFDYLAEHRPGLAERVIFTTGDTVSSDSWAFLQQTQQPFISKPFKPQTVLAQVGALLSR